MSDSTYTLKPFPSIRHATIDLLATANRKHMIHGLIELDVTDVRRRLHAYRRATGETLSFTGYLIYCCARAVDQNKHMHAYRDWRNRLVLFDAVDVSTTVERRVDGRAQVVPTIIRAANRKTVLQIHRAIRRAQQRDARQAGVYRTIRWYLAIPPFIRRLFFKLIDRVPGLLKQNVGTVMVTAVGMFGQGAGWGLPIASHTLNLTIGGVVPRARVVSGALQTREHLCLTVSFDHDLIDGAPAARFIQRFKALVESGRGLDAQYSPV